VFRDRGEGAALYGEGDGNDLYVDENWSLGLLETVMDHGREVAGGYILSELRSCSLLGLECREGRSVQDL